MDWNCHSNLFIFGETDDHCWYTRNQCDSSETAAAHWRIRSSSRFASFCYFSRSAIDWKWGIIVFQKLLMRLWSMIWPLLYFWRVSIFQSSLFHMVLFRLPSYGTHNNGRKESCLYWINLIYTKLPLRFINFSLQSFLFLLLFSWGVGLDVQFCSVWLNRLWFFFYQNN